MWRVRRAERPRAAPLTRLRRRAVRPPPPKEPPVFEYKLRETDGRRDGAIPFQVKFRLVSNPPALLMPPGMMLLES
jgi:hypothetical protein